MEAPQSGVKIRMYRQGHGDCFLLAFRQESGNPFYMLIDCGYFPGSKIHHELEDIAQDIKEATDGHLNLVVITHEHQDHVNGFRFSSSKNIFKDVTIDKLWLAWTEDPNNDFANELRRKYNDVLIGIVAAGNSMSSSDDPISKAISLRLNELLAFEVENDKPFAASIEGITNKKAIKFVKDKADAREGTQYLKPHSTPIKLPNVEGIRIFVLGPPENEAFLKDNDPNHGEGFEFSGPTNEGQALFAAALDHGALKNWNFDDKDPKDWIEKNQPFNAKYRHKIDIDKKGISLIEKEPHHTVLSMVEHYNSKDFSWRKIDQDWLHGAEQFALRMGNYINNTSLVLAIELPESKKILLFPGDAQRGNWISWFEQSFTFECTDDETREINVEDLLGRTVLYKVGHHGSHNATLKSQGLELMALGPYEDQFVAMIPANQEWANQVKNWSHPLPTIYDALIQKARGRVFLANVDHIPKPNTDQLSDQAWNIFKSFTKESELYFEYTILDSMVTDVAPNNS